jgi:hypothetical protein
MEKEGNTSKVFLLVTNAFRRKFILVNLHVAFINLQLVEFLISKTHKPNAVTICVAHLYSQWRQGARW